MGSLHVSPGWSITLSAVILTFGTTVHLSDQRRIHRCLQRCWISRGVGNPRDVHHVLHVPDPPAASQRTDAAPSLGSAGILINVGAACFLLVDWIVVFFPIDKNMTATTTNWNVVMYRGTVAFAVTYCFVVGRKQYRAPVDLVKRHPQDGLAR
ncbi:amino acid permease [Marssonina coronariae]|uniref:Amino acid permease n=1 Tax=Diplocarpon coronariae TaxID=2795749 RepID=A0A218YU32_9HELO|nr:amino acid permease [Marssonina coronariae]